MAANGDDAEACEQNPPEQTGKVEKYLALSEEDSVLLTKWWEDLILQDARYPAAVLRLGGMAMINNVFRSRLVNETEAVLAEVRKQHPELEIPTGVTLRFFDNTQETLSVVLPPRADEMSQRSPAVRDALRSRTSELFSPMDDENLFGDWFWTDHNFGDYKTKDHGG